MERASAGPVSWHRKCSGPTSAIGYGRVLASIARATASPWRAPGMSHTLRSINRPGEWALTLAYAESREAADPWCLADGEASRLLAGHPWRRFAVLGDSVAEGVFEPTEG